MDATTGRNHAPTLKNTTKNELKNEEVNDDDTGANANEEEEGNDDDANASTFVGAAQWLPQKIDLTSTARQQSSNKPDAIW